MSKRTLIVSGLIILVPMMVFLVFMFEQPSKPLALTATFIAYTNDATGGRLAAFTISNNSHVRIRRWDRYEIEIPDQVGQRPTIFRGRSIVLDPGQSEAFVIPVPTNQESWRVLFHCSPYGIRQDFADWANKSGNWKYLPPSLRGVPGQYVRSDWIQK